MTKKELSQLFWLNREISEEKRKLMELEAAAEGGTAKITGMPHASGVSNQVERYSIEIAELRDIIDAKIKIAWHELNRLNRYIESVDDPQMRLILSLRFVNGLPWEQVAASIGGGNTANGVQMAAMRFLAQS